MNRRQLIALFGACLVSLWLPSTPTRAQLDPLRSWSEGAAKQAIVDFVSRVTRDGSPDFIPVPERIATFDNDGTLWAEQPIYVQAEFVLAHAKELAKDNPDLASRQPFKAILNDDKAGLAALGEKGIADLMIATHSGMSTSAFEKTVSDWLATARHPRFDRPYTSLTYQPMIELLAYLRANGFKTYIVSGGGIDFMRPWTEKTYGIPPEQVIGSSGKTVYRLEGDVPVIDKLPHVDFVDDGPGKPLGIHHFIGRRPIFAAGNSDGDLQMLQWTTLSPGPRFALIVHHTDAEREYAYDRQSPVGRLDKTIDEAPKRGWLVVDMKNDWKKVFSFEP